MRVSHQECSLRAFLDSNTLKILRSAAVLEAWRAAQRSAGKSVGFVPTMGALHPGHISLLKFAQEKTDVRLCSIFVNPTQFNDPSDFEKYPITTEEDLRLLAIEGVDAVYLPSKEDIYPDNQRATSFDFGHLEAVLEGAHRPGHFAGVGMVVNILLEQTQPDWLFLGQKDFQQCAIIRDLLRQTQRSDKVQLAIVPTVREKDGLAMSSRNVRLRPEERAQAPAIHRALLRLKSGLLAGENLQQAKIAAINLLSSEWFSVEYLTVVDSENLTEAEQPKKGQKLTACVAAGIGNVRLIDNEPFIY